MSLRELLFSAAFLPYSIDQREFAALGNAHFTMDKLVVEQGDGGGADEFVALIDAADFRKRICVEVEKFDAANVRPETFREQLVVAGMAGHDDIRLKRPRPSNQCGAGKIGRDQSG